MTDAQPERRVRKAALPVFVHLTVCSPFSVTMISCELLHQTPWTGREAEQWRGKGEHVTAQGGAGREIKEQHTHTYSKTWGHMQTEARIQVYMKTHTQTKQAEAHTQSEHRLNVIISSTTWEKEEGKRAPQKRQDRQENKMWTENWNFPTAHSNQLIKPRLVICKIFASFFVSDCNKAHCKNYQPTAGCNKAENSLKWSD